MTGATQAAPGSDLIDRAWLILIGAALCMFCSQPASILFTFGIFSPEIAAETGWSAISIAGAIAPGTIAGALMAPLIGRAADRFGARRLVMIGGPAYGLGFQVLAAVPTSPVTFTICLGLTCGLGFAAIPVLYAQLASGWFARRRGLALSLLFTASSLGIAFWSIYATALLQHFSWRGAYAIFGATAAAIIFTAGLLLIRNPPARSLAADAPVVPGLGAGEAMRTFTFWKVALIFVLITGILSGCTVPLPGILRSMGVAPNIAAAVIPLVGVGMFVGRLSAGVMLDRWFAPRVVAAFITFSLLGMAVMLLAPGKIVFFAAAAFLGMGIGAEMDAAAYIVSRAFGLKSFGAIYGLITMGYGVSGAIGTGAFGAAVAASVPPSTLFAIGLVTLAAAILLLLTIRRGDLPFAVET